MWPNNIHAPPLTQPRPTLIHVEHVGDLEALVYVDIEWAMNPELYVYLWMNIKFELVVW